MKRGPALLSQLRARESGTVRIRRRRTIYLLHLSVSGVQNGCGMLFDFARTVAADANAHATATTRTIVLTARFMALLLTCGSPGSGNPEWRDYNVT